MGWLSGALSGFGVNSNDGSHRVSSSVPERRPRMLLKCWGRFQPSSERARSVGPGPPLDPSLRLPAAPEGTGGGGGRLVRLGERECGKGSTGRKASDIGEAGTAGKKCWLVYTHKATRTDVPDMEILSKKGKWISQMRMQMQSRGVRYP